MLQNSRPPEQSSERKLIDIITRAASKVLKETSTASCEAEVLQSLQKSRLLDGLVHEIWSVKQASKPDLAPGILDSFPAAQSPQERLASCEWERVQLAIKDTQRVS